MTHMKVVFIGDSGKFIPGAYQLAIIASINTIANQERNDSGILPLTRRQIRNSAAHPPDTAQRRLRRADIDTPGATAAIIPNRIISG